RRWTPGGPRRAPARTRPARPWPGSGAHAPRTGSGLPHSKLPWQLLGPLARERPGGNGRARPGGEPTPPDGPTLQQERMLADRPGFSDPEPARHPNSPRPRPGPDARRLAPTRAPATLGARVAPRDASVAVAQ